MGLTLVVADRISLLKRCRQSHQLNQNRKVRISFLLWLQLKRKKKKKQRFKPKQMDNVGRFIMKLMRFLDQKHTHFCYSIQSLLMPRIKIILLIFVFFLYFSGYFTELKCHCDVCVDDNYTCITDGMCFTSIQIEKGQPIYSYR